MQLDINLLNIERIKYHLIKTEMIKVNEIINKSE